MFGGVGSGPDGFVKVAAGVAEHVAPVLSGHVWFGGGGGGAGPSSLFGTNPGFRPSADGLSLSVALVVLVVFAP